MASSFCVHLLRPASIHPFHHHRCQQQTFRKPAPLWPSPAYAHANLTSSLMIRASCSFPNRLLSTGQKHKTQSLSPKTLQHPNLIFTSSSTTTSRSTICMAALWENTTTSEDTPKFLGTEICILSFVYIIPFLNRLNLLSRFPVLKYAMSPILPLLGLLGFYQSIGPLDLIVLLTLFIGVLRYRSFFTKSNYYYMPKRFNYPLQAKVMDSVIVIAALVHPFLVYPDPSAVGALGFQYQLLNVLELLCFQACIRSCLKFLGAVQWVVPSGVSWAVQRVVGSDVSYPSIDTLFQIMEVVLKTYGNEGRREGKSLVWKLLRANGSLLSDANYAKTFNKVILSSCQSCLSSLLDLFKNAENCSSLCYNYVVDEQISVVADNLSWLLDILIDRRAAEEFALMWANQQKLANLHSKTKTHSRHLVSCITTRLLIGAGNGEIRLAKDTRQLLLQTWFQPLVDDFSRLRKLSSFDPRVVEENVERAILDLTPENQRSLLLAWYECFLKNGGDKCPDLRIAFQGWCRRTFSKTPPHLSLLFK